MPTQQMSAPEALAFKHFRSTTRCRHNSPVPGRRARPIGTSSRAVVASAGLRRQKGRGRNRDHHVDPDASERPQRQACPSTETVVVFCRRQVERAR
jgi:hypothetical protein